jgi:hypothetical protein
VISILLLCEYFLFGFLGEGGHVDVEIGRLEVKIMVLPARDLTIRRDIMQRMCLILMEIMWSAFITSLFG